MKNFIEWQINTFLGKNKHGRPKYHLARTRKPYRMKMKQATPEQLEEGKDINLKELPF
jgi:hypothetical protein